MKTSAFGPAVNGLRSLDLTGCYFTDKPMKTRWLMRSSNGSIWATTYMFTEAEVLSFQCARPVRRLTDDEEQDLPAGTIK